MPNSFRASGISCQPTLFVDPVLCVAAPMAGARQDHQLLMPFVSHREKYIISPYIDWLSFQPLLAQAHGRHSQSDD